MKRAFETSITQSASLCQAVALGVVLVASLSYGSSMDIGSTRSLGYGSITTTGSQNHSTSAQSKDLPRIVRICPNLMVDTTLGKSLNPTCQDMDLGDLKIHD